MVLELIYPVDEQNKSDFYFLPSKPVVGSDNFFFSYSPLTLIR
jgi:hypothetical protein